jgi:hypothetical protein
MRCAGLQESGRDGWEQHGGDQHTDQHSRVCQHMHVLTFLQERHHSVCSGLSTHGLCCCRLVMSVQQQCVQDRPVLDLVSCSLLTPDMLLFGHNFIR